MKTETLVWTLDNQQAALKQGWGVFDNSEHGLRIERNDDLERFTCDEAARAYVALAALRGNDLCRCACAFLAVHYAVHSP